MRARFTAAKGPGVLVVMKAILLTAAIVLAALSPATAAIAPDREIVPLDDPEMPLWKSNWDSGRKAAREGDYVKAAEFYNELISQKPQIETAKWEYCKILFRLRDYAQLPALLESLIENNSHKLEYLEMAGHVLLKQKEYRRAVSYLGQVYAARPGGEKGAKALDGIVNGLLGLGRDQYALPLMEQLLQRRPHDPALIKLIAETAHNVDLNEKAMEYYKLLISTFMVTDSLLEEAAEVIMAAGDADTAAGVWQKIVQRDPQSVDYHRRLYRYFLQKNLPEDALPHMMKVIESGVDSEPELLLIAGRLYFYDVGRADKALNLFERYLLSMPEHHEIKTEISAVREKIAVDLLSIVENDGAEILWKDLDKITNDRLIIFNLMADKLERARKTTAAIDVLEIIYEQTSADSTALRLARLHSLRGDKAQSYRHYKSVKDKANLTLRYYKKKAAFENLLGLDREALETYKTMLQLDPDNITLRVRALDLAGQLGLIKDIEDLAQPVLSGKFKKENLNLYLTYAKSVRRAGQYSAAENTYKHLLAEQGFSGAMSSRILLDYADLFGKMGLFFEQQQIYRQLLALSADNFTAAVRLLECSLLDGAIDDGWKLYKILEKRFQQKGADHPELISAYVSLLEADGRVVKAVQELEQYVSKYRKQIVSAKVIQTVLPLEIDLCRLYIQLEDVEKCSSILKRYPKEDHVSLKIRFLKNIVEGNGTINVENIIRDTMSAENSSGGITSLFLAAKLSEKFNDNKGALGVIDRILRLEPNSMRARVERALLLRKNGNLAESSEMFKELSEQYAGDVYLVKTFLELEGQRGNYHEILAKTENIGSGDYKDLFTLLRARALWGEERQDEALDLYRKLLAPPVNSQLQDELTKHNLKTDLRDKSAKKTFWGMFYYDLSNRLDNLNALDERDGFLSLLETKEGQIVADLYSAYRYEKTISNEYLARKAIEEKRYIAAEKQYRRSLLEDRSTEGLKDLAKIYKRLGDYGKEAEIYSVMEKQGESSPVIQESIERNKLTRAPTLSLDSYFFKQEGRDGAIDLEKKSGGVSFQFLPQISSSIELKYEENKYTSVTGPNSLAGRKISGNGWWEITDSTLFSYDLGYHLLDSDYDSTLVYECRLDQEIENQLKGYLEYGLDIVDDTIEALEQAIDAESITTGIIIEGESGFTIGGEYSRLSYSDDNSQDKIYLWSSYSIFSEFTTITFQYSYELIRNSEGGLVVTDPETGEEEYSLPYWSPDNYWQHLLTFRFHHLLTNFATFKQDPSYYSLDLNVGLESDDNFIFNSNLDIFLEMSDNFLLKGNLYYLTSNEYDENIASLSLMYRW